MHESLMPGRGSDGRRCFHSVDRLSPAGRTAGARGAAGCKRGSLMKLSFGWIGIGIGVAIAGASVGMVKLRNEKPIAVINGEKITRASFIAAMEKDQGAGVLRRLIQEKLVLQEAKKKGLLPTQAQVQAEIAQMRETEPDLDRQLKLRGKSMEELSMDVRGRLAMANLIAADVKLPDAEVKKLWAANQKKFNR